MSCKLCRSDVDRRCFPGSAQIDTCLAGCVDGVPERSEKPSNGLWLTKMAIPDELAKNFQQSQNLNLLPREASIRPDNISGRTNHAG
jgi:hypothetical protein